MLQKSWIRFSQNIGLALNLSFQGKKKKPNPQQNSYLFIYSLLSRTFLALPQPVNTDTTINTTTLTQSYANCYKCNSPLSIRTVHSPFRPFISHRLELFYSILLFLSAFSLMENRTLFLVTNLRYTRWSNEMVVQGLFLPCCLSSLSVRCCEHHPQNTWILKRESLAVVAEGWVQARIRK